jgi:hypothetical protein
VIQNNSPPVNGKSGTNLSTNAGVISEPGIDAVTKQDLDDPTEESKLLSAGPNSDQVNAPSEGPLASSQPTETTGSKVPKKSGSGTIAGAQGFKVVALVAGIVSIVSLIQVIIGSLYNDNCPVNPYIPIYLIVAGVLGLLLPVFLVCLVRFRLF